MTPNKSNSLVLPLNVEELDSQLRQLTSAYSDALKFVEQQPSRVRLLSVKRVTNGQPKNSKRSFSKLNWLIGKKLAIFPFVRLFIEGHMRYKLEHILRQLQNELHPLTGKDDIRYKKLSHMVKHLNQSLQMIAGWKRFGHHIITSKLLSTVLSLLAPIIAVYIGVNISSASEIGEWFSQLVQSDDTPRLVDFLQNFIGLLLLIYVLFVPPIINTGFRVKRAIFAGGTIVADLFRKRHSELDGVYRWSDFPITNIYRLENQVYEILGTKKPTEFPLDITLSYETYFLLFWSVLIAVALITISVDGNRLQFRDSIFTLLILGLCGRRFWSAYRHYRNRKQDKNL